MPSIPATHALVTARQGSSNYDQFRDAQNSVRTGATVISVGVIIAIVVGILAVICIAVAICCLLSKRNTRRAAAHGHNFTNNYTSPNNGEYYHQKEPYCPDDATDSTAAGTTEEPPKYYPGESGQSGGYNGAYNSQLHREALAGVKPAHTANHDNTDGAIGGSSGHTSGQ